MEDLAGPSWRYLQPFVGSIAKLGLIGEAGKRLTPATVGSGTAGEDDRDTRIFASIAFTSHIETVG